MASTANMKLRERSNREIIERKPYLDGMIKEMTQERLFFNRNNEPVQQFVYPDELVCSFEKQEFAQKMHEVRQNDSRCLMTMIWKTKRK